MSHETIYIDAYNTNAGSFLKDYDWYESFDPKKKYPKNKTMNNKNYTYCILEFYDKKYIVMERYLDDKEKIVLSNYCQCTFCISKWDEYSPGLLTINLNGCLKGMYPAQWNIKQAEILLNKKIVTNTNTINLKNYKVLTKLQKLFQTPVKITVNDINSLTNNDTIKNIELQIKKLEFIEPKKEPKKEPIKNIKPPKKLIRNYRKTRPENISELYEELEKATNKIPIKFSPSHTFLLIKLFNCLNDKYYELRDSFHAMRTFDNFETVLNEANTQKTFLETVINTVNKFGVLNLSVNFIILKNNAEIIIKSVLQNKERSILIIETKKQQDDFDIQVKKNSQLGEKCSKIFNNIKNEIEYGNITSDITNNYCKKCNEYTNSIKEYSKQKNNFANKIMTLSKKINKYREEELNNPDKQYTIAEQIIATLKEEKMVRDEVMDMLKKEERYFNSINKLTLEELKK